VGLCLGEDVAGIMNLPDLDTIRKRTDDKVSDLFGTEDTKI
jgi:hypothetical protein